MFKTALILQGGGTREAFSAGVLDVLLENDFQFDFIAGTSAGALSGLNYVSKNKGRNLYVLTTLMKEKKFCSFRNLIKNRSIFNFDYLFNEAAKGDFPFDFDEFYKSNTTLIAAATCLETGKVTYFEKGDSDFWEGVAASASLPLLSKPVQIKELHYLDGGPVCGLPFRTALDRGIKKIVVVCTRQKGYRKQKHSNSHTKLCKKLYKSYPNFIDAYDNEYIVYNNDMDEMERLAESGAIFMIYPKEPVTISHTEKNEKKIRDLYEKGVEVMKENLPILTAYLKNE
ncbi:MAG: patatin family protein [Bacilli bacterium]|nr:patatin family protein [Bacilli bacterium]MDY6430239.1 patatin family protein [Bacilli bacterium]